MLLHTLAPALAKAFIDDVMATWDLTEGYVEIPKKPRVNPGLAWQLFAFVNAATS